MFTAGASIPFAMERYKTEKTINPKVYIRIMRRVALLWILGMVCQGNLLALKIEGLYLFSNTLQAIAIGYLIATVVYLNMNFKWQIITAALLLITYWAILQFVTVGNYGNGNFTPEANISQYVDMQLLGRWRDGVTFAADGSWQPAPWYHYTWILSSLTFGVTVLTGAFAGAILKLRMPPRKTLTILAVTGTLMTAVGWLWSIETPVIKTIWTPSMTLVSSGYCTLLLCLFYYLFDVRGATRGMKWLTAYGANAITAYVLFSVVNFSCMSASLFFGFEQYLGNWYPLLLTLVNSGWLFLLLWVMYRKGIFIKV